MDLAYSVHSFHSSNKFILHSSIKMREHVPISNVAKVMLNRYSNNNRKVIIIYRRNLPSKQVWLLNINLQLFN